MRRSVLESVSRVVLLLALPACLLAGCGNEATPEPSVKTRTQAFSVASQVFINEIHYDNEGTDSGEAIEVAGPAGTDLSGWSLVLYNGVGGLVYGTVALSGVLSDQQGGYGAVSIDFPVNGIQNGAPDGLALLNAASEVVEFLSYEGSFVAAEGPAAGLTSTDIDVSETATTPAGHSLGRTGTGSVNHDFVWGGPVQSSFGSVNLGQSFGGGGDAAPRLVSTTPENGAFDVEPTANLELSFSEAVHLGPGALTLLCNGSSKSFAVSGGPEVFTVTPAAPFSPGDSCTLTILRAGVSDQDSEDPPDSMTNDVSVSFQVPLPATIAQIQGAGHISPLENTVVRVTGVVTVVQNTGFYMQSTAPDKHIETSEGLLVFTSSAPAVSVGDLVSVSGQVVEFRPGCFNCSASESAYNNLTITEITTPNSVTVLSSDNPVPQPTLIGRGGRKPPKRIIDDDTIGSVEVAAQTSFDPKKDGIDFYESLEGMLVVVNDAKAVSPTNRFGEIAIVTDMGEIANKLSSRGGIVIRPNDFNPERILLDDAIVPNPPNVHVGASFIEPVVGVISYSFGNFKLNNSEPLVVSGATSLQREVFELGEPSDRELDLGTFNVENLSPSDPPAKFAALANIVVHHLKSPDILTLEEVQDNSGPTNNGVVDASQTLTLLAQAIQSAGGPLYQFAEIAPEDGQDGGQPGGNIRVAFLYDPARGVSLIERPGASATTPNQVVDNGRVELLYSPGRIDPQNPAFANSRKPLAAEFEFAGQRVFVVANHWNSKGGDQPLFGRLQPPVLGSEVQRVAQAEVVASFVGQIVALDKRARVVVMGDLNDFQFSAPLAILEDVGLKGLIDTLPVNERYTYVFDGNSQALDHIFLSKGARRNGFFYDIVHVNAEFFDQVSDHDPSVVRIVVD